MWKFYSILTFTKLHCIIKYISIHLLNLEYTKTMKKKLTILALAISLILVLTCCARPRYVMGISALDSGGVEACEFDIDVAAGAYPSISVLVSYAGPEAELGIYTGSPMVGLAIYDGDGRLVGASATDTVLELITLRKDEPKGTPFDLSLLAKNVGGSLSEGAYRLEVTLSYALSQTSGGIRTVSRSFALELIKAA